MKMKKEASERGSLSGDRVALTATSGFGATSRRAFLGQGAALGAAAAFGGLILPRPARAAAPVRGGRLRMGISGSSTSDSLDPALPFSAMAAVVAIGQCRNGLIEVDAGGNLVPELCEEWESTTDDATGWRFMIRSGVEFHNGKSLEVEDVIFSINQHRASDKSALRALLSSIVEIRDDGARGLLIRLESGNADFPFLLSDPRLQIYPSGTTDFNSGIGTGGYILEVWDPGLRAFSRRNPNYWKEGHANFDEVETIAIEDVNARTSALRSGDVDVINRVERATAKRLDAVEGVNVVVQNGYKHYTLPMRADTPPFDNNDVRLAIKYACKRQQMLDQVLFGYGKLGNDHPIGDFNRYIASEEELPQRRYDPDKARFHLKQAGMENLKVQLYSSDVAFEGAVDAASLYKESARDCGIDIEIVRHPPDGYWSNVWMNQAWCMSYWSGRPTEDWQFTEGYLSTANYNDTFWRNERFDRLLFEARSELDEGRRREMYVEMQRMVSNEGGQVVPAFAADLLGASDALAHGDVAANWDADGYRLADRWWFA